MTDYQVAQANLQQEIAELKRRLVSEPNNLQFQIALCQRYEQTKEWAELSLCAKGALSQVQPGDPGAVIYIAYLYLMALANGSDPQSVSDAYANIRPMVYAAVKWPAPTSSKVKVKDPFGLFVACGIIGHDENLIAAAFRKWLPKSVGVELPVRLARYEKLASWCARHQVPVKEVSAPLRVQVTIDDHIWSYHADGFYLAAIPSGEVLCGWDFVVTADGTVLADSGDRPIRDPKLRWFPHQSLVPDRVAHLWGTNTQYVDANTLFLGGPEGMFIGHWIVDFLPRLREETLAYLPDLHIAIPKDLPLKQRSLLKYFGIAEERLIECDLGKRYKFRNLVVAQHGWFVRRPHPDAVRSMAVHLRKPLGRAAAKRLFIQRSSVATRQIANWPDVKAVLDRFGFAFADLALLDIEEQRERIGSAEIVIATYGSDLLACFFMQPKTDFIEFRYDPYMDAAAGPMCAMSDVNYHVLLGQPAETSAVVIMKKDSDFVVDCEKLADLLANITDRVPELGIARIKVELRPERSEDAQESLGTLAYRGKAIPKK